MIKGYKWRLSTLLASWLEVMSATVIVLCFASYIEVIATHHLSWWNLFNVFLNKM